jgi:hypothetical protein
MKRSVCNMSAIMNLAVRPPGNGAWRWIRVDADAGGPWRGVCWDDAVAPGSGAVQREADAADLVSQRVEPVFDAACVDAEGVDELVGSV